MQPANSKSPGALSFQHFLHKPSACLYCIINITTVASITVFCLFFSMLMYTGWFNIKAVQCNIYRSSTGLLWASPHNFGAVQQTDREHCGGDQCRHFKNQITFLEFIFYTPRCYVNFLHCSVSSVLSFLHVFSLMQWYLNVRWQKVTYWSTYTPGIDLFFYKTHLLGTSESCLFEWSINGFVSKGWDSGYQVERYNFDLLSASSS